MAGYYIGFDCGTQSTKTSIYNQDYKCIADVQIPNNIKYPRTGWAEMDADSYLASVHEGIRKCLKKSRINPKDIKAISGDGIICGVAGINKEGKAITPYIPYLDSRASEDARWINESVEPIWVTESGNSHVEAFYPPVLTRWMLKHDERFQKEGVKVVPNGSYVLMRLAGLEAKEAFIDWATLSGWLVGYDAIKKEWSKRQMELLEIPMEVLPKIVKPWDIIGHISKETAEATGLCEGIPIAAGAGDTMQSNLGSGLVKTGMAADVAGTAAMFTIMVDGINEELSRNSDLLFSIGTLEDTYFYWGYVRTGGLSLRWFRDCICEREGDDTFYDEIQKEAEKVPAGSNGTLFLPYLQGGSETMVNASGCFLNMTMVSGQGELWRAILESIAYEYRALTEIFRKNGISVGQIVITEGGSKSSLWNQIKADVLHADITTLKQVEGAVMSNILVAAYAIGDITNLKETVLELIEVKESFAPKEENQDTYENIYWLQQEIIHFHMPKTFHSLAKLQKK